MTRVNFLIQCEPCGKRLYRTRRAAKHALRVLHPQERGRMAAYPCPNGNTGHHIGHRPGLHATPAWPAWADTTVELRCDRCDQLVRVGEPVAYTCGDAVCIDCGEVAEREAIAHRNTHPAGPIPHTTEEAS